MSSPQQAAAQQQPPLKMSTFQKIHSSPKLSVLFFLLCFGGLAMSIFMLIKLNQSYDNSLASTNFFTDSTRDWYYFFTWYASFLIGLIGLSYLDFFGVYPLLFFIVAFGTIAIACAALAISESKKGNIVFGPRQKTIAKTSIYVGIVLIVCSITYGFAHYKNRPQTPKSPSPSPQPQVTNRYYNSPTK